MKFWCSFNRSNPSITPPPPVLHHQTPPHNNYTHLFANGTSGGELIVLQTVDKEERNIKVRVDIICSVLGQIIPEGADGGAGNKGINNIVPRNRNYANEDSNWYFTCKLSTNKFILNKHSSPRTSAIWNRSHRTLDPELLFASRYTETEPQWITNIPQPRPRGNYHGTYITTNGHPVPKGRTERIGSILHSSQSLLSFLPPQELKATKFHSWWF